ncbi:MAG: L,D-transpeptidase family protein [Woeseia sp.]|nr:L,D-transpeptidase family protein [Woeseia sp.]
MVIANPDVDVWLPGAGTKVLLPTRYVLPSGPRQGVVLNLAEYRMYYYPPASGAARPVVMTFPISIGRMDWETPLGITRVVAKARNPAWYPPASVRAEHEADGRPLPSIVPPGPDNPLGNFAMRLGLPGYLIHGTNRPAGVGMRVTHGCIRMFPEDIEYLFEQLSLDTPVRIINEPLKVGWDGEELVLEVHRVLSTAPPQDTVLADLADPVSVGTPVADSVDLETDSTAQSSVQSAHTLTELTAQFVAVTKVRQGAIDWALAERELATPNGIPLTIGSSIKNAATSAAFE